MDQQAFFAAIDQTIKKVAESEFLRLSTGITTEESSEKVRTALDALGGLRHGNPPDYNDPWVALFYLTWYQPGQILLSRRLIDHISRIKGNRQLTINDSRSLQVVDFGCGVLAMRFAIAWASAEAIENGQDIKSIRIISLDPGIAMVELGVRLWKEFLLEIRNDSRLRSLSHSSEKVIEPRDITLQLSRSSQHIERTPSITYCGMHTDNLTTVPLAESVTSLVNWRDGYCCLCDTIARRDVTEDQVERWLTAIHTVYAGCLEDTKRDLDKTAKGFDPDIGLMSCHHNHQSISNLRQASPFESPKYRHTALSIPWHESDYLPSVTQWRKSLNQPIPVHVFLDSDVTWKFPQAFGQFYTRQA